MNYECDIIQILREVGMQGMPLRRIALNVYNMRNSFFMPLVREDVYADVAYYLRTCVMKSGSPIEKADTRGWYRLNFSSATVQQLLLDFQSEED